MCGIFGIIDFNDNCKKEIILKDLLLESSRRGKDATGVSVFGGENSYLIKKQGNAKKLINSTEYKSRVLPLIDRSKMLIGQCRLATDGSPKLSLNNQPMREGEIFLVHNGIIINARDLSKKYKLRLRQSDSRILTKVLEIESRKLKSMSRALIKVSGEIAGTLNLIVVERRNKRLTFNAVSNNGSLYVGKTKKWLLFASERIFLERVARKNNFEIKIDQIKAGTGMEVCSNTITIKYNIKKSLISKERAKITIVSKEITKHNLDKGIEKIKRCVKCLLPINTPNIIFDSNGVCNYCREYKKIKYGSDNKLRELVKKYRNKKGEADCIIAFSGGRDSAYGLHYLVEELGMHPVAVTFDWGMISNIGRRNQARMLGKLGIEQIIISADLKKVRSDIKKNLMAWLRKPDLGMVPLLMQADKVTEYYVDKVKKELGLELVFFCRGNELEREEFKAGYCGVKNADPGGVIHNYSLADKLRLLRYYIKQFISNPYYLNSSLFSSMLGYLVTYVVPHNYIYLWHYIRWEEKKIIKTLFDEYAWEDDAETGITWRIDDGSPAFYNYLYGQIQGFTENDSFRSNQIREGLLSRKQALEIVSRENKPRYSAIQWYMSMIGVNGDRVLSTIDKVEKRYKSDKIG